MAKPTERESGEVHLVGDDVVLPFSVKNLDVRGRAVQLGSMLDSMFGRHDYPPAISSLLGEVIVLTVLLGTSLKFDGKFIVQTQTDGPVSLLVVDFTTPDSVRAYARYDENAVGKMIDSGQAKPSDLLGKGALGLTIDQGQYMQQYQGIVELDGHSLEDVARQYFRQSEQIPTEIRIAAAEIFTRSDEDGSLVRRWRAGGVLTQFLPEASERIKPRDLPGGNPDIDVEGDEPEDDSWTEAKLLTKTVRDDELTDPSIASEQLLYRLFHEHGVRAFAGIGVFDKCSCSREKVVEMVKGFSSEDREASFRDEVIETTCEFCSTKYSIARDEIEVGNS